MKIGIVAFSSIALLSFLHPLPAHGEGEVGFLEKFALAPDRDAVLSELVPGSEDYYFFHALHYQNSRQKDKLTEILGQWAKRLPNSSQREMILNREALLSYDATPQETLAFLRKRLDLRFTHEQEVRDQKPDLPSRLDPARISRAAFEEVALRLGATLDKVADSGLEALIRDKADLNPPQIRALLSRLKRPDVPGLLDIIEANLKTKESRSFGEFEIHRALLPEQLDDLAKRLPALAENQAFIVTRLRKLAPSADADPEFDHKEREAWLDRAWAYVSQLAPAYNSLKANILFHRLQHDRASGIYDEARFFAYIQLPRRAAYNNRDFIRPSEQSRAMVDLGADFTTAMPIAQRIGSDESLVRDYFLHLFAQFAAQPDNLDPTEILKKWTPYVRDTWLKPVLAEALITNGIGQPERWASLIAPNAFQALKERVDVEFSPANRQFYAPADDVSLDLLLKNTPKLIVKIYEINALSYFIANHRQLNTDLPLDGLVANQEITRDFSAEKDRLNPFRRLATTFNFPFLTGKRGAWIIELIGGGKSSRALIRKGQWSILQRPGPAGDMVTVLNEAREPVKDAVLWLDGHKLSVDEKSGSIIVPFAQERSEDAVVSDSAGEFASLVSVQRHAERYMLDAHVHVAQEQLIAGKQATLALRAELHLDSLRMPLDLLQNAKLRVVSYTLDKVETAVEVKIEKFDPAKDFTYTFTVPDRLRSLNFQLSGTVPTMAPLGDGTQTLELNASDELDANGIASSDVTIAGSMRKVGDDYVLDVLGRNGEPVPNHPIDFQFGRADFSDAVHLSLRTDEQGRVEMGPMRGIDWVAWSGHHEWRLRSAERNYPAVIHSKSGQPIVIPWSGQTPPEHASLLEMRNGTFTANLRSAIQGFPKGAWIPGQQRDTSIRPLTPELSSFVISGLPPGDYSLALEGIPQPIEIRVTDGKVVEHWLVSPNRNLGFTNDPKLDIQSIIRDGETVVIQLANADKLTRVHVAATRFVPDKTIFGALASTKWVASGTGTPARMPNLFTAERQIGDEFRYILERRYSKAFPGNMLSRPGLLLDPWEVRSTDLEAQHMAAMHSFLRSAGGRNASASTTPASPSQIVIEQDKTLASRGADLNFLANPAPVLYNLTPNEHGVIRIDPKLLGDRQYLEIYAEDLTDAVSHTFTLPDAPTAFKDLRLARNLDPQKRFTETKAQSVLAPGQTIKLADDLTGKSQIYDSLASVYTLFTSLNQNPNLAKFAWILEWPKLKPEEKLAKYSEFACHELNFFLKRKDPEFFTRVIRPYLLNKKDKTFMDDYLLGNELRRYLSPWSYERLNAAERCLLAQSIPGEAPATARHLRELWELLPPDPDKEDTLFETALGVQSLSAPAGSAADATRGGSAVADSSGRNRVPAEEPTSSLSAPPVTAHAERALIQPIPGLEPIPSAPAAAAPMAGPGTPAESKPDSVQLITEEEALRERASIRQFFHPLGATREWAENNYYQLPIAAQNADLISVNAFWRDYAAWDGKSPFVSAYLTEATRNFSEMMLALAALDLPFESPKPVAAGDAAQITAASPLIAFHKEIKPAGAPKENADLLVSESFFRASERYRMEGNEKFDNYVTDEFLSGDVYGANVVVTNPSSSPRKAEVLMQIPEGAIPVQGSRATDSKRVDLQPFTTQPLEYYFYFPIPRPEPFAHYPASVSIDGQSAGSAKPTTFKVVRQLSQVNTKSWDFVSQFGSEEDVFHYLDRENIARLDLTRIAWRARKSADFFQKLITLLTKRHIYNDVLYSYSVFHNDAPSLGEWLRHRDDFTAQCGPWLNSKLLAIDPVERRAYEHLEYAPLVNQRVHRVGADHRIPNPILRSQYLSLLNILAYKPTMDAGDQMSVTYYLFLQDRTEEALARLHAIAPAALPTRLQYDYFQCYADFFEERIADARGIANQYVNYPVDRWRKLFADVSAQLEEIEGKSTTPAKEAPPAKDAAPATVRHSDFVIPPGDLAASEPSFDFKVENRQIALTWKNLGEVSIRYYRMDPEFLFSASPFVTQDSDRVSITKPTASSVEKLPAEKDSLIIPLPGEFEKANVLVEILAAGQRKSQPYHANTLKLAIAENYGRMEVRDQLAGKPVPKAYVKVYARLRNGTVRFYKDGYTDLRGKFDYASLNSGDPGNPTPIPGAPPASPDNDNFQMLQPQELHSVEKLSILIMSDAHGALVREVNPPAE